MKVALFGRSGFIGANVANILQERNIPFVGVSRADSLDNIPDVTTAIICSSKLPQKTYDANDIREFINSNVLGLINILEWTKRRNVSRVVYCSTLSMMPKKNDRTELVDTQSHYPYKISKAAAEHLLIGYCRENKINYMDLRIASVYGPGMKPDVIHTMIQTAKSGGTFVLNDRSAQADFVHVSDVALAVVESATLQPANRIINITSGAPVKLAILWELVKKVVGNQNASIEIKGDTTSPSHEYSAADFNGMLDRPTIDLKTGILELIQTYS